MGDARRTAASRSLPRARRRRTVASRSKPHSRQIESGREVNSASAAAVSPPRERQVRRRRPHHKRTCGPPDARRPGRCVEDRVDDGDETPSIAACRAAPPTTRGPTWPGRRVAPTTDRRPAPPSPAGPPRTRPDWHSSARTRSRPEYVRGRVHTNGLENFWSLVKRAIHGTYVSIEPFHVFRYLDEATYRFNNRETSDGPLDAIPDDWSGPVPPWPSSRPRRSRMKR